MLYTLYRSMEKYYFRPIHSWKLENIDSPKAWLSLYPRQYAINFPPFTIIVIDALAAKFDPYWWLSIGIFNCRFQSAISTIYM